MPILLRHNQMDEKQRSHAKVAGYRQAVASRYTESVEDVGWRFCVWFRKALDRPCNNWSWVFLQPWTPLEVLQTCRQEDPTGRRLVAEAVRSLSQDLTDCKRPILVLSDWLEEYGQPEHRLLREFCNLRQRWHRYCVRQPGGYPTPQPLPPYPEPTLGESP